MALSTDKMLHLSYVGGSSWFAKGERMALCLGEWGGARDASLMSGRRAFGQIF